MINSSISNWDVEQFLKHLIITGLCFLLLCEVISCFSLSRERGLIFILRLLPYLLIGVIAYAIFSISWRKSSTFIEIVAAFLLLYESFLCLMQLAGLKASKHLLYPITGSFGNPGLLGGMIAVLLSITVCASFAHRKCKNISEKAIFTLMLSASIAGLSVFPATMSRTAWIAFIVSMFVFAFGRVQFRQYIIRNRKVIILNIALVLLFSFLMFYIKRESALGRLHIWRIELLAIADKPLIGYGTGKAMGVYGETQASFFQFADRSSATKLVAGCPEYPFNEFLRLGIEIGIPGMIIAVAVIIFSVILLLYRGSPLGYGMIAIGIFAIGSYPLNDNMMKVVLVLLLAASCSSKIEYGNRPYICGLVVFSIAVSILWLIPEYKKIADARYQWNVEKQNLALGFSDKVSDSLASLYKYLCDDYRYLFDYGYALHKSGNYTKSTIVLEKGAELSSDPMFHNIIGKNYELLGLYDKACDKYMHAYYMVPSRIYPLLLFMRCRIRMGDNSGAIKVGKTILEMPLNPKVKTMKRLKYEASIIVDSLDKCNIGNKIEVLSITD